MSFFVQMLIYGLRQEVDNPGCKRERPLNPWIKS